MVSKRATKIDAVLRHLAAGGDVGDFPGTKYENLAVVRTAVRRGLIAWDSEGNRYILTPTGWSELAPGRFGVRSLVASTAIGAATGAALLAFFWLPGLKLQSSAQATASPVVEKPIVAAAAPPADIGGRSLAPMTATTVAAKPARAPAVTPAPSAEPAPAAAEPAPEPPAVETPPLKHAAVKKPRRKTVRRHEQTSPFGAFGQASSYPRYGQGSWYSYR
jgi:hypothetical protein